MSISRGVREHFRDKAILCGFPSGRLFCVYKKTEIHGTFACYAIVEFHGPSMLVYAFS